MAAIQPVAFTPVSGQITVTGATAAGTLIFDATQIIVSGNQVGGGISGQWIVDIANMDVDSGDDFYIGFTAATATVAAGFPLGIRSDTTSAHSIRLVVPPHAKIYGNCTNGETRDIRVAAYPLV